jgi:hypothetical protein
MDEKVFAAVRPRAYMEHLYAMRPEWIEHESFTASPSRAHQTQADESDWAHCYGAPEEERCFTYFNKYNKVALDTVPYILGRARTIKYMVAHTLKRLKDVGCRAMNSSPEPPARHCEA